MNINENKAFRVVVALGILLISLLIVNYKIKQPRSINEITMWPDISIDKMIGGQMQANKHLFRYVQFVGTPDNNNIELLRSVYREWSGRICIIVFVRNAKLLKEKISYDISKALIISENYDERVSKYKSTKYGKHYLFNNKGYLLYSSDNNNGYKKGILLPLLQYIGNHEFNINKLIAENDIIQEKKEYIQLETIMNNMQEEYLLVCLIYNYCDSCGSSTLVDTFRKINNYKGNPFHIMIILSQEYSSIEVEQFKSQLQINYTVLIADDSLDVKWNKLVRESAMNYYSDIVAVVNRSGRVEKVLDPHCNECAPLFWEWIKERIEKKMEE